MPDEQNIQRIIAYIAQNSAAYSLDALRDQLLAAGYSVDDVDAAFARSAQPPPQAPQEEEPQAPAPLATSDEAAIERMVDYLQRNRQQYTLEALRQQMLGQGQPPALVEAAMERVAPTRSSAPPRRRWTLVALIVVANIVLLPALTGLLSYLATLIFDNNLFTWIALLLVVAEVIGGVALLFNPRWRWLGIGLLLGLVLTIAIAAALIVIGLVLFLSWCATLLNGGA